MKKDQAKEIQDLQNLKTITFFQKKRKKSSDSEPKHHTLTF